MKVTDTIKYVGVNDHQVDLFEGQYKVPNGMSYNSYVILDEKIAVMDTVDANFTHQWLDNIQQVLENRKPDYLIVQHMEPDHAANIANFLKAYPDTTVVATAKAFNMIDNFFELKLEGQKIEMGNGGTLSLGYHQLTFVFAPMVHWPETMVTFDETEGILFSGDAFGCFGALNGGCIDRNINTDIYWNEMRRYYANIVGKFGNPVQKALQKCGGLPIKTICPTHGPVWEECIPQVVDMYDKLSRYEGEEGVVIVYGTMYGNTEELAEAIAEELSAQGIKNIILHNVSHTHHSYILADIFKYKALIAGCTTYNMHLYPEMESLLSKVAAREMKNRLFGYFGSFTWASAAVKKLGEFTEKLKFEVVGNPVEMKQSMKADNYAQAKELAKAMADRLKADRK